MVDLKGKVVLIIKGNYKYFVIPLGFLALLWAGFFILNQYERPINFESKKPIVVYFEEETQKTLKELEDKGYTGNIGPYFEQVRMHILAKNLGIMKYRLKANDNLWTLARHCRINIDSIVGANSYLKSLTNLKVNQELILISSKGILHRIKENETPKSIAALFCIAENKLEENNNIPAVLKPDEYLFVPGVEPLDLTEEMKAQYALTKLFGSPIFSGARKYTSFMKIRSDPFTGEKSFHDGLDIQAFANDKICAVASGTVIFSGENGGFGLMVKIKHDNGYTTLYGHNSRLYVVTGQKVKQGHIIAQAGSTGRSTGIHLHFTVWDKNNKLVDPTLMLTKTK